MLTKTIVHKLDADDAKGRYCIILSSNLFDAAFYLREYPDVFDDCVDPIAHYIESGSAEGRWPNPLFDPDYYRRACEEAGFPAPANLLCHFVVEGWKIPLPTHLNFDSAYYLAQYGDRIPRSTIPLAHYLAVGAFSGLRPSRRFDPRLYSRSVPLAKRAGSNPLLHALQYNLTELGNPARLPEITERTALCRQLHFSIDQFTFDRFLGCSGWVFHEKLAITHVEAISQLMSLRVGRTGAYGRERPDVQRDYRMPNAAACGLEVSGLEVGRGSVVSLRLQFGNGKWLEVPLATVDRTGDRWTIEPLTPDCTARLMDARDGQGIAVANHAPAADVTTHAGALSNVAFLLVEQATQLREGGRIGAAKVATLLLSELQPDHPELGRLNGELAEAQGEHAVAQRIYAAAVGACPADAWRRVRLARSLGGLGRHPEALAVLAEGLATAPTQPELLVERAEQLRGSAQFDAAEAAINSLAAHHAEYPLLGRLRGELAQARGDQHAARRIYSADLESESGDVGRRVRLARCLSVLGQDAEAQAILSDGLALAPSAELLIARVLLLQEKGQVECAEAAIGALAVIHPSHPELRRLRGELAETAGNLKAARRIFAADLKARPHDQRRRLRLIRILGHLGRHHVVRHVLSEGLAMAPTSVELLLEHAIQLQSTGEQAAAKAAIMTLALHYPQHPEQGRVRGALAEALGDHQSARTIYAEDLAARPQDVWRRVRLARSLGGLGRHDEADALLDQGLAMAPGADELLLERAAQARCAGHFDAAQLAIDRLADRYPAHPQLGRLRGELAEARGDREIARRIYADDLAARPGDVWRRVRLARTLGGLGKHGEAQSVVVEGLETAPVAAELLVEQASQLRGAHRIEDAQAAILMLASHHPNHPRLAQLRGELAEATGEHETACAIFAADAAADPRNQERRLRWAHSLGWGLGRHDEAQAILSNALAMSPASAELLVERASQLRAAGKVEAAQAAIDALMEHHPNHPRLGQLRGELAEARGDREAARSLYAADLEAHPRDVWRRVRLARLLGGMARHSDAQSVLSEELALKPDSAELMVERASQLRGGERYAACKAAIDTLEAHHPGHEQLGQLRGELAEAMGDLGAALRVYEADLAVRPHDVGRRLRLAFCLRSTGLLDEALALLGARSTLAERHMAMDCLLMQGRWEQVSRMLGEGPAAEAGTLWLDETSIRMRLAISQFDCISAARYANAMLAVAPHDPRALLGVAQSAMGAFDSELAWKALLRVGAVPAGGGPIRAGAGRLRHFFGQIVNDQRLRGVHTDELAEATRRGNETLVTTAASQLQADPGSIGASMGLLVGLSRAGRLCERTQSLGDKPLIPKTLHQFWDSFAPPDDVLQIMTHAATVNSDHHYRRWNDGSARELLATLHDPEPLRAYRFATHVAMRSDILRLAALYVHGGLYLDADDYCTAPLRTLVPEGAELVCYHEDIGSIGNNFLAARPGLPLIGRALMEAAEAVLAGAAELVWLVTGPGLMSRTIANAIARERNLSVPVGLYVVPLSAFRGVVQAGRWTSYKVDRRHWSRAA